MLVGVFDWYAALLDKARPLPSGMPLQGLQIWFTVFLLLMALLLLNMLLAVVLIHYCLVKELAIQKDGNPIWTQAHNFLKRKVETYRHGMSLRKIHTLLQKTTKSNVLDTGVVTQESLMEAFPSMSSDQAMWLETTFTSELYTERSCNQKLEDTNSRHARNESLMKSVARKVHELSAITKQNTMKIVDAEAQMKVQGNCFEANPKHVRPVPAMSPKTAFRTKSWPGARRKTSDMPKPHEEAS